MNAHLRTLFVIADGAHARWVERSKSADDFVTIRELKASPPPLRRPQGVAFEGSSGRRANVEEGAQAVRQHHLRFAGEVADAVNAEAAVAGFERLALIAPARILGEIRKRLGHEAGAKLARSLAKDLTKIPDHDLGRWLRGLELG